MTTMETPASAEDRRALRWFLLIAFVLLAAGMGLRDPWPSDEPRFTLAARQMVESGDWLFPHRGSELYADKPPMLMWLEGSSYELVRNWRVAFLLPSLLAAMLTLVLTYDLGRRLFDRRAGLYAAGAVLCTFQFMYQMKRAQIDPLVTFWITMANWGLLRHLLRGPDWRAYWLGCFAAGLGVITKGVGVLALLMLVPYAVARWRGWDGVTRTEHATLRWLGGVLAFVAAVAIWLVPMVLAVKLNGTPEHAAYLDDILFRQTAKRYADSWSHAQPFWYFVPILLFNWFPLSLAYPGLVPQWWRDLRAGDARVLLPLAWFALVLVFFSIPTGKRDVYILPALPMVALAAGPHLGRLVRTRWLRLAALAVTVGGGRLIVGAGARTLHGGWATAQKFLERRELLDDATTVVSLVLAAGVVMLLAAAWFRATRGVHALLVGVGAFWLIWSFGVYPVLNDSSSARGVMIRTGEVIGPAAELGLVAWKEQNLLMADRPAVDFGFKQPMAAQYARAVQWQRQSPERRWVFALDKALGDCVDRERAVHAGHANRRDWWLFRADAVRAGCVPDVSD